MSRSQKKGGLSPEALFDEDGVTGEGPFVDGQGGGTEVLGGLVSEDAALIVESGRHAGERVALSAGTCVIGRSSKCGLVLRRSAGVSRRHSKIVYADGIYEVSDCGSRNGTRVNGNKIGVGFPLNDGDLIQISDERVRFRGPSGRESDAAAPGLLVEPEPLERRLPSREQPGDIQRTQRVRVDSPDSLLLTKDGGTAPGRPVPPPSRKNPVIPAQRGASPKAETALFPAQVQARRMQQPPPVIMPPSTTLPTPARQETPKGALFALGILLGVTVLVGGVTAWDLWLNERRVLGALANDLGLLPSGVDAAPDKPAAPAAGAEGSGATPPTTNGASEPDEALEEQRAPAPQNALAEPQEPPQPEALDEPKPPSEAAPPDVRRASAAQAPPPESGPALGALVEVKASVGGRVRSIAVSAGDVVRTGDTLLVIDRSSPRIARKLSSLRREEKAFEKHAALGNARAKGDLQEVRAEIARLERRAGTSEVKAPSDGRVEGLLIDTGGRVKSGAVLVRLAAGE